jgi:hypothetical protein
MSDINKIFGHGTFDVATGSTTVYTVDAASGSYAFLKSVLISNVTTATVTYTILINGSEFPMSASLTTTDKMIAIPYLDVVLSAGATVGGYASGSDTVKYYFSGREITV